MCVWAWQLDTHAGTRSTVAQKSNSTLVIQKLIITSTGIFVWFIKMGKHTDRSQQKWFSPTWLFLFSSKSITIQIFYRFRVSNFKNKTLGVDRILPGEFTVVSWEILVELMALPELLVLFISTWTEIILSATPTESHPTELFEVTDRYGSWPAL